MHTAITPDADQARSDINLGLSDAGGPGPLHLPVDAVAPKGEASDRLSNVLYVAILLLSLVLGLVLKLSAPDALITFYSFSSCQSPTCAGNQAIYRVSFALCLFFLLMVAATFALREAAHSGYWCIKLLLHACLVAVSFLIPGEFFVGYAEAARVCSFVFLVIQIVILVDMAHDLHEYLLYDDSGDGPSTFNKTRYLVVCLPLLLLAVVGTALLFSLYGDCSANVGFTAVNMVLGLLIICLSVSALVDKGLLVPACVWAYGTFMTWQALSSNPEAACNPYRGDRNDLRLTVVAAVVTVVSLTWACWSAAKSAPYTLSVQATEGGSGVQTRLWYIHLVMALGSLYSSMLLTNWGVEDDGSDALGRESTESMWIKAGSCWLTYVLCLWSMAAPSLCPHRDFSDTHNQFRSSG